MSVFERVKKIITDVMAVKETEVSAETSLANDLGADSLDYIALLQELEAEFNIQIPDADAQKLKTVEDTVKYIERKVNNKG
ncbi:MAG: acyl carrier protein [Candidatus Cloacimonadota bacterium]|nr:MAG: acyl carrier protein [Candidatus Cloacimonadota bacterium]